MILVTLFLLINVSLADTCAKKKPIVFIPGILASILEASVNIPANADVPLPSKCDRSMEQTRLWVAIKTIRPIANECYMDYLTPLWDSANKQQKDIEGIDVISPRFGSTYACDSVDPNWPASLVTKSFHDLIDKFEDLGYVDGDNMVGASYDWRYYRFNEYKHKRNWYEDTKQLIINTYNKYGKVVVITHSMGGLMFYKFIDIVGQQFTDKYIDNWVAISAPFLGAAKTMAAAFPGDSLGLPLTAKRLRPICRRIETIPFLFPNGGTAKYGNDILLKVKSTGKTYNADQLVELVKSLNDKDFQENALHVIEHGMKEIFLKHNYQVPFGIKMNCLISSGEETIKTVEMENESYDSDHTLIYGDGDGTVPIQSLEFCKKMGAATFKNLGKYTHTGILDDKASYEEVKKFVCN